jgi:hypothetical protein
LKIALSQIETVANFLNDKINEQQKSQRLKFYSQKLIGLKENLIKNGRFLIYDSRGNDNSSNYGSSKCCLILLNDLFLHCEEKINGILVNNFDQTLFDVISNNNNEVNFDIKFSYDTTDLKFEKNEEDLTINFIFQNGKTKLYSFDNSKEFHAWIDALEKYF